MSEWKIKVLSDVAQIVIGGTPSTAIPEYWDGDIDWVTAKDISKAQTSYIINTERKITRLGLENSSAKLLPPLTTVLIARGATMGKCRILKKEMALNQTCYGFIADKETDQLYLYFYLSTLEKYFNDISHGTVFNTVIKGSLGTLPIPLPPLAEQRAIAAILAGFDDKIEANRRLNATLEATARALFQSWFVDFDPVRANAEGRPPDGMDAATAALFPDSFVESELGTIPKGWRVQALSDHVKAVKGLSYKGSGLAEDGDGMPMHNLNSVYEGGGYKYEGIKHYTGDYQARHIARAGDLIVTNTEQGHDMLLIGYPALIPNCYPEGLFSHHLYRVMPLEESHITARFLYFLMRTHFFHEVISGYTNGTTVNMLPVDGLQRPLFVVPPPEVVVRFERIVASMLANMEVHHEESEMLAVARDALLPRLISGEIRVE